MSFYLYLLRNWDLYGTSSWESMSSGRQKKLMKLAEGKVNTWSQKMSKKFKKKTKFYKYLEMIRECFRRVSVMFLGLYECFSGERRALRASQR